MKSAIGRTLLTSFLVLWVAAMTAPVALAEMVVSDGSDGAFHPLGSQTINLEDVAPDGIFNFTTIHIPEGATITFLHNNLNTPVFFAATGDCSSRVRLTSPAGASAGSEGRAAGTAAPPVRMRPAAPASGPHPAKVAR